ncbi:MAG: hypothetical protein J6D28_04605 [Bacilli bacterium]|nr:hypothetical protein [Bacilli bacterium]
MELTVSGIVAFVTLILGQITKKLGLVNKKYIPIQSIIVGLLSGLIVWLVELDTNIISAMLTCVISSLGASGLYDVAEIGMKKGE